MIKKGLSLFLVFVTMQAQAFQFDVEKFKNKYLPIPEETQVRCQKYGMKRYAYNALVREYFLQSGDLLQQLNETNNLKSTSLTRIKKLPEDQKAAAIAASEIYGHSSVQMFLNQMSDWNQSEFNIVTQLTALTHHNGYDSDEHCGHSSGLTMDLRPLPAYLANTWMDTDINRYNREMNKKFIAKLITLPEVSLIFFDDPVLLKDSELQELVVEKKKTMPTFTYSSYKHTYVLNGVEAKVSHDNHIHVEILPPQGVIQDLRQIIKENNLFYGL